ncbi:aspartyl/asparaginyl beta-hydroxylase domain-containing protein [Dyella caseinilytica]|uniref:Aspartyl/asparaginyl beta-hydroxylase domain-containing protein n=1 Tax=Dyella caseinilytica TaxID=1849581 RepID=A0ABX7GVP8_9GAMM|nr:aspartyl/asparaginyl beta-hydroxylase domain-containing protein [Dyella caseinilytica]QRN53817.1 aspartyl/asparaginyl beta-hydroxylase domain-containing protein [Dyella caseinilytica]GFZ89396.1 aspartyl beta-hydroxylase [Dyella caseinilytica]
MSLLYDLSANTVRRIYDARINTPPVLDTGVYFPDASKFTAGWQAIRDEALAIAAQRMQTVPRFHEIMPAQAPISANDGKDWRLFVLKVYGTDIDKNLAACPQLAQIIASSPDVLSASLSFLAPRKHIPRHRGPFRGVLRYQLGLSVPTDADGRPAAVLSLNDEEHRVGDGQHLLWDDTYPHEVWNNSDDMRAVLLLDVRRQHMPMDLRMLSSALIASVGMFARFRGVP